MSYSITGKYINTELFNNLSVPSLTNNKFFCNNNGINYNTCNSSENSKRNKCPLACSNYNNCVDNPNENCKNIIINDRCTNSQLQRCCDTCSKYKPVYETETPETCNSRINMLGKINGIPVPCTRFDVLSCPIQCQERDKLINNSISNNQTVSPANNNQTVSPANNNQTVSPANNNQTVSPVNNNQSNNNYDINVCKMNNLNLQQELNKIQSVMNNLNLPQELNKIQSVINNLQQKLK